MLYTTYLRNISKIPEGVTTYFVARYLPGKLDMEKHNIIHKIELAPEAELLKYYKDEIITWDEFRVRFEVYMESDPKMLKVLNGILDELKQGKDICFVCYEKKLCHRFILAEWFKGRGIEWKEI